MTKVYSIQLHYFSNFYKNIFLLPFIINKLIKKYQAYRLF